MSTQIEAVAKAINLEGWTCLEGSDVPGSYDECDECKRVCDVAAEYVLAATHPTITTVEELDALPDETVVKDGEGYVLERQHLDDEPGAFTWCAAGVGADVPAHLITLPATVLYWSTR